MVSLTDAVKLCHQHYSHYACLFYAIFDTMMLTDDTYVAISIFAVLLSYNNNDIIMTYLITTYIPYVIK